MCGGAVLAPIAAIASLVSGKSRGVQSYSPQEQEFSAGNPEPDTPEPTLGVDTANDANKAARRGKQSLVNRRDIQNRNPSVGVAGAAGSGVSVPKG